MKDPKPATAGFLLLERIVCFKAGLQSRIPENTRSRSRIFCQTPEFQLNHFIRYTSKLGIPSRACWNGTISYGTFVETANSCCVCHDFCWLLVATKRLRAKLHSLYVRKSESEILEARSRSRTFYLRLRNPTFKTDRCAALFQDVNKNSGVGSRTAGHQPPDGCDETKSFRQQPHMGDGSRNGPLQVRPS